MIPAICTQPRSPGSNLDDLLASRFLPKRWAGRIWSADKLPRRLAQCAKNLLPGTEWRAYGDHDQILFAIARAHADPRPESAAVAIDVYFLDDSAAVYSAGVWEYERERGWWLDAVLEVSFNEEHGWWLDALVDPQASIDPEVATFIPRALKVRRLTAPSRLDGAPAAGKARKRPREGT